jgi:transcriptional regulator with XRE-family HTH domain
MQILSSNTEQAVLREIGARIERLRLERNWTQSFLSEQAGVGVRTLQRLESGEVSSQLSSLIRILRVLELQDRWDLLIPAPTPSPVELVKMQGKRRKRASRSSGDPDKTSVVRESPSNWTWGE